VTSLLSPHRVEFLSYALHFISFDRERERERASSSSSPSLSPLTLFSIANNNHNYSHNQSIHLSDSLKKMEKSDPPPVPKPGATIIPSSDPIPNADPIPSSSFHRRSRSDDMSMFMFMDPLSSAAPPSSDDLPSDDDLFSSFIDVDSLTSNPNPFQNPSLSSNSVSGAANPPPPPSSRPRHRHSNSVDAGCAMYAGDIMDAKKAMPPEKLSELWNIDPKRAKRSFFFFFKFVSLSTELKNCNEIRDLITGF